MISYCVIARHRRSRNDAASLAMTRTDRVLPRHSGALRQRQLRRQPETQKAPSFLTGLGDVRFSTSVKRS
jgi:hypothetical protein